MGVIVNFYIFVQIGIVIIAIVGFVIWDKRYHKNHGLSVPKGFEGTQEITIDPSDWKKTQGLLQQ